MKLAPAHPPSQPHVRPRILLAEDDYQFRVLLAGALSEDGFDVEAVADGNLLIDRLSHAVSADGALDGYDLIVSDIRMPGFSALDVLAAMRRLLARTPVILITAFGDRKTHDLAKGLGAVAVLDKPFEVSALRREVCDHLRRGWRGST